MKNEKLLIVEDEKIIAIDLQRRLEKFGYNVAGLVASGKESIQKARKLYPDIVLMDIMLAGEIDGIDAAITIRKELNIPIIFITAYSDEKTLERAKKAEPFGYVLKPFKDRELYTTIDIALYKHSINEKLKSQERLFAAILNGTGDGIISTTMEGKIRFMNPVAETLTGWKEEDAIDKPLKDVFKLYNETSATEIEFPTAASEYIHSTPWIFESCYLENKQGAQVFVEGNMTFIHDKDGDAEGKVFTFKDVTEMKRLTDTVTYQASHDRLTGLLNRDEFSQKLQNALDETKNSHVSHTLINLDLDQFKIVNDTSGHRAGDQLIQRITKTIQNNLPDNSIVARIGGDEFGILISDTDTDKAEKVTKRIFKQMQKERFIWKRNIYSITASVGIVPVTENSKDTQTILAAADDACFLAKEEGGNRIKIYSISDIRFLKRRGEMQWISKLTQALEEDRFVLYYQLIEPLTAKPVNQFKCELLIRMLDTDGSLIMPLDFIPAAERYNLMHAIDKWVITKAIQSFTKLSQKFGLKDSDFNFSINLSASSLNNDILYDFIKNEINTYDIPASSLCFEVTETTAIENLTKATSLMRELQKIGCTFALDDFGSGFSSFSYLKDLPVDYLKIDGAFVKDINSNKINYTMVESINKVGHVMNIKTIGEFVANSKIKDALKGIGVDYAQGYEINKPQPLEDIGSFLNLSKNK